MDATKVRAVDEDPQAELADMLRSALEAADRLGLQLVGVRISEALDLLEASR